MLRIRLSRRGAKKIPFYDIVVIDGREKQSGRAIERVGYFNPCARGKEIPLKLDTTRVDHWLSHGAQPSDRVAHLVKKSRAKEGSGTVES
ncbi:MAG: 30S ribosomal protein S16 [Candidatus Eutrophobiaceae bacterium]